MLKGIHFLLTYSCNFECDHCFLHCGPQAKGTFTLERLQKALDEVVKIGTIEWVYFEGGEPFMFYPLMLEGIRIAGERGFKTGIVTNAYWATSSEDAELWLEPFRQLKLEDLSISDDPFHFPDEEDNRAKCAFAAAKKLRIPVGTICIEKPALQESSVAQENKGKPVVGGGVLFKGRAAEKLIEGLPKKPWQELRECPYEKLSDPERVHLDPYGHVHLCQGISMGNMWKIPLSTLVKNYDAYSHPICGPLLEGGPRLLAEVYGVTHEQGYVDECHFCYQLRKSLVDRFPEFLAPRQVYGLL